MGLAILAFVAWSFPLRADSLTVQLDQSTLTVPVDTTEVTFSGTIANLSPDTLYLNADSSTTSSSLLTVDDTPFLTGAPLFLDPSDNSGDVGLFNVFLDPSTTAGIYTGVFTIEGGPDAGAGTDFSDLVDIPFTIDVTSPVSAPEPGTLLMLCCGLLMLVLRARNRRLDAGGRSS